MIAAENPVSRARAAGRTGGLYCDGEREDADPHDLATTPSMMGIKMRRRR